MASGNNTTSSTSACKLAMYCHCITMMTPMNCCCCDLNIDFHLMSDYIVTCMQTVFVVCGLEAIAEEVSLLACVVKHGYHSVSKYQWYKGEISLNATLLYMLLCVECIGATYVLVRVNSQKTLVSLLQVSHCSLRFVRDNSVNPSSLCLAR